MSAIICPSISPCLGHSWAWEGVAVYTFTQYTSQQIGHAVCRLDGSNHEEITLHLKPIDVISSTTNELRQEGALGTAIAFTEGMEVVGGAVEVHELVCKGIVGQASEVILSFEAIENQRGASFDFF